MAAEPKVHTFKFFCYCCKRHVTINAETQKAAHTIFHRTGHTDVKVAQLERDFVTANAYSLVTP